MSNEGKIYRVAGPVVTAVGISPRMYDVVHVGDEQLMGEVIKIVGDKLLYKGNFGHDEVFVGSDKFAHHDILVINAYFIAFAQQTFHLQRVFTLRKIRKKTLTFLATLRNRRWDLFSRFSTTAKWEAFATSACTLEKSMPELKSTIRLRKNASV